MPDEYSFLMRRIEKLEAQVRSLQGSGSRQAAKNKSNATFIWAVCRRDEGMEANRVVKIWTDENDDTPGVTQSCDYIDVEDEELDIGSENFMFGVTAHSVVSSEIIEDDRNVMIQITGDVLVAFESIEDNRVILGDMLYPYGSEGKIAHVEDVDNLDDVINIPLFRALESELEDGTYDAIYCKIMPLQRVHLYVATEDADEEKIPGRRIKQDSTLIGDEIYFWEQQEP